MKLIKEYTTPTTIYIVGSCDFEKDAYLITDDYCTAQVRGNRKLQTLETDGGITIFEDVNELLEELNKKDDVEELESLDYTTFVDFKGELYISLVDSKDNDVLIENPDFNEYLSHQRKLDDGEWNEVKITTYGTYSSGLTRPFKKFLIENGFDVEED